MDYKWRKWRRKDLLEQNRFTVSYSFGCYCCPHLRAFVLVTNKLNNSKIIVISIFHRIARKSDNFPLICGVMICLRVFSMRCLKSIDVEKRMKSFEWKNAWIKIQSSNRQISDPEIQIANILPLDFHKTTPFFLLLAIPVFRWISFAHAIYLRISKQWKRIGAWERMCHQLKIYDRFNWCMSFTWAILFLILFILQHFDQIKQTM